MGTRHLIGVVLDGDFKVAQYGQWDGYPGGQGDTVLNFLEKVDLDDFREKVRAVRFLTPEDQAEIDAAWTTVGADGSGWVTMEQSDAFYANPRFAPLSRNVGAEILNLVAEGKVEFLEDMRDFAYDSLFCEYAYIVDLDAGELEFYKGFNEEVPTAGRWAGDTRKSKDYYAINRVGVYKLDNLPNVQELAELDAALDEERHG